MTAMANLLSFAPSSRPRRRTPIPTPRLLIAPPSLTISASVLPSPPPPPSFLPSSTRTITSLLSSASSITTAASAPPHLLFARVPQRFRTRHLILSLLRATILWLDLYVLLLEVRLLLRWIPDIPWLQKPLAALRYIFDLMCDPFLNLFRNIIPPTVSDDLDLRLILVIDLCLSLSSLLLYAHNSF